MGSHTKNQRSRHVKMYFHLDLCALRSLERDLSAMLRWRSGLLSRWRSALLSRWRSGLLSRLLRLKSKIIEHRNFMSRWKKSYIQLLKLAYFSSKSGKTYFVVHSNKYSLNFLGALPCTFWGVMRPKISNIAWLNKRKTTTKLRYTHGVGSFVEHFDFGVADAGTRGFGRAGGCWRASWHLWRHCGVAGWT